MVSALGQTNVLTQMTSVARQDDIKKLVKYVKNESLQDVPDTFLSNAKSAVGSAALFEGLPLASFMLRARKVPNLVTSEGSKIVIKDAMKAMDEKTMTALKNVFKGKDGSFGKRLFDYLKTSNQTKKDFINLKDATKATKKAATQYAKKNRNANKLMSAIDTAIEKADYFVNPNKTNLRNAQLAFNEAMEALAKNPSSKKLQKAVEKASKNLEKLSLISSGAKQVGKLGQIKNFMKSSGAGIMLVFSGISELTSEVVPTFKELGAKKGLKQLGKSTVKVVADTAAFVVGEQAFTALGTAIGTAICPGIGTAVGAICGFVGGMIGSFVAGKATKAILGKSEREIAKEQLEQEQIKLIQSDSASLEELKQIVTAKISQEQATGQLSEDSMIAMKALENIEMANPFLVGV